MLLCNAQQQQPWQHLLSHRPHTSVYLPQIRDCSFFLLEATSACCALVWHKDLIVIDCLIKANCIELQSNPRREEGSFSYLCNKSLTINLEWHMCVEKQLSQLSVVHFLSCIFLQEFVQNLFCM